MIGKVYITEPNIREWMMGMDSYLLSEYYTRYLRDIRKNGESTVKHYMGALENVSEFLRNRGKIKKSIYEIEDIEDLRTIKKYLDNDSEYINQNIRGHRMYSAALNNYLKFALGEGLSGVGEDIVLLDQIIEMKPKKVMQRQEQWKRSTIIKNQVLEMSDHQCEIDRMHKTFIAASTQLAYMEGHHIIPMNQQGRFSVSIDIYANVICLCPICHRMLHYGMESEKRRVLEIIYDNRKKRLKNSGIFLSQNEFVELAQ